MLKLESSLALCSVAWLPMEEISIMLSLACGVCPTGARVVPVQILEFLIKIFKFTLFPLNTTLILKLSIHLVYVWYSFGTWKV